MDVGSINSFHDWWNWRYFIPRFPMVSLHSPLEMKNRRGLVASRPCNSFRSEANCGRLPDTSNVQSWAPSFLRIPGLSVGNRRLFNRTSNSFRCEIVGTLFELFERLFLYSPFIHCFLKREILMSAQSSNLISLYLFYFPIISTNFY